MALELSLLETLPPAVEKVAGAKAPGALKLMAARGLAPLGPADFVTAIYQLAQGEDAAIKAAALKSATELPEKIFQGALGEPIDRRVLDFFARRLWQKPKLLEIVLLNKATDDETVRHLASLCAEAELELIAKNEERLLRTPTIIAALYLNPKTRMSTAQRALELAVRNNVRVEGIPAFDEAVRAIEQSGAPSKEEAAAADAAFQRATEIAVDALAGMLTAASPEEAAALEAEEAARAEAEAEGQVEPESAAEAEEKKKRLDELSPAAKIRMAQLGNAFTRAVLIRDTNKQVAMACIRSPGVSDAEAMHYARNRALDDDVIRFIANKRLWVRLYGVKVALCNNPKCPLPVSMRFLPHLRPPDLKSLARSRGIPSALASAAKQLLTSRGV
jgi:hypothetical protein